MGQPIGYRSDDHSLNQTCTPAADDQEVGFLTLADGHDRRSGIAQFLDGGEIDVVEIDGVFDRRQHLLLTGDQGF
jgi:hypothetical protein